MKMKIGIAAALLVLGTAGISLLRGQGAPAESSLTVTVPAAVEATIKAEGAGGKILDIRREKQDQGMMYFASVQSGKSEYNISVHENGKLQRKELAGQEERNKTIPLEQAPDAVKKTLARESDDTKIAEVERQEGQTTYSAEYTIGKDKFSLQVLSDGTLLAKERSDANPEEKKAE